MSRNGDPSPLGKCDTSLDVPMSSALKEKLAALGVINGSPASTYVRRVLELHVFGSLAIMRHTVSGEPIDDHPKNVGSER